MRTLTYALIILAGAQVLALTVQLPAVAFLLQHAGFASFLPLSFATAAGITNDRVVLIGTVVLVLLFTIPGPVERLATALLPIGLGILVGTLIGKGIREAQRDGEPVHRTPEC